MVRVDADPLKTINRSLHYYSEAAIHLIRTGNPLILVNYEGFCANKYEFIHMIYKFTVINLDKYSVFLL